MGRKRIQKLRKLFRDNYIQLLVLCVAVGGVICCLVSENHYSCPHRDFHIFSEGSEPVTHNKKVIYRMFRASSQPAINDVVSDRNGAFQSEISFSREDALWKSLDHSQM